MFITTSTFKKYPIYNTLIPFKHVTINMKFPLYTDLPSWKHRKISYPTLNQTNSKYEHYSLPSVWQHSINDGQQKHRQTPTYSLATSKSE